MPADTTFHLPKHTSYEEAATIPLAAMTAADGLFQRLDIPQSWSGNRQDGQVKDGQPSPSHGPLLIWGGASAVGAFAIKLARRVNSGPIIAVAGRGVAFVEGLLDKSKGDAVVDYRQDEDKVIAAIQKAAGGQPIIRAFDAISEERTFTTIGKVLAPGGKMSLILSGRDCSKLPSTIEHNVMMVGDVHGKPQVQSDLGFAWFRLFSKGLREGWFTGHPHEVIPGGLGGVETGLRNLMEGKNSGVKYVYRIAETK